MDNLIYIWIVNHFLEFFGKIAPLCVGSAGIALIFFLFACGGMLDELGCERAKYYTCCFRKWLVWSTALSFLFGLSGTFTLNKAEFKTVAVYLIGKEIVQSDRGEKIITIIDTKLDEWIKKIEK